MNAWLAQYREERRAVIAANDGAADLSVISLLPRAPTGVWNQVSRTVAQLPSPPRFLSNLFCELSLDASASIGEEPLWLDGFLGSYGSRQDPRLLLPGISLWLSAADAVSPAANGVADAVRDWEILTARSLPRSAARLPAADELGPFLPHSRVPDPALSASFLEAVAECLSRRHPDER